LHLQDHERAGKPFVVDLERTLLELERFIGRRTGRDKKDGSPPLGKTAARGTASALWLGRRDGNGRVHFGSERPVFVPDRHICLRDARYRVDRPEIQSTLPVKLRSGKLVEKSAATRRTRHSAFEEEGMFRFWIP